MSEWQTGGRGRIGKKWISKKGNLFISIFFRLNQKKINFKQFAVLNAFLIKKIISDKISRKIKIKWPNDLLYIFPVVILGTIACVVGLAVLDPAMLGDKANPFATPLEILPEWYLYPVFQILRVVPNKLLGIALQTLIPLGLMILPFIENVNKFSNPFRRPIAMSVFLFGTFLTIYLGIGACLPIDKSLTLGLF